MNFFRIFLFTIAGLMILGLGEGKAQKSLKQIEMEYNASIRDYMDDLQGEFARRYITNEQFLLDMIVVLTSEFIERRKSGSLRKGQIEAMNLGMDLESLRNEMLDMAEQMAQLRLIRKRGAADSVDEQVIRTRIQHYETVYAKEYELTRIKVAKVRDQLIKLGRETENRRMLQAQLKKAFVRYLQQEYETAVLEFNDIVNCYGELYKEWDDVLYYLGESYMQIGDLDNADVIYERIIRDYPSSKYVPRAFNKLFAIAYIRTDRPRMNRYLTDYQSRVMRTSKNDDQYDRLIFMAGLTFFEASDYLKARDVFAQLPANSRYYLSAQYMIGHCFANREDYYNASDYFQKVADHKTGTHVAQQELFRQLIDMARLKLAFIQFEQAINGQKLRAVYPLASKIREDSEYHDLALLTIAWSAFKDNNIDSSRIYVDSLIRAYPVSEYIYEAKTLRGNIDVLDPTLTDRERELIAIESYNYVATAMEAKYMADAYIQERDSSYTILRNLAEARQIAAVRKDSVSFLRYNAIYELLALTQNKSGFSVATEDNPRVARLYHLFSELVSQLRVTQGKLLDAEEAKNVPLARQLKRKLDQLAGQIEALGLQQSGTFVVFGKSLTDSAQLARRNEVIRSAKERVAREKEQLNLQISAVEYDLNQARREGRMDETDRLEQKYRELNRNMVQLTEHETWLNSIGILDSRTLKRVAGAHYVDKSLRDILGAEVASVGFDNTDNAELTAYFTQHRLARITSEIEARNKKMNVLKEKAAREKEQVLYQISVVDQLIQQAEQQNRLETRLKLSHYKNRLTDIYNQICKYEMLVGVQPVIESYSDLGLWGDFAIYGKNNITYVINTTKSESIHDLTRAITQIDNILVNRRKNYERKIAVLEEEIMLKEQEIRDKELREMRSSQKQFFDKEYFAVKESEQPEDDPFEYKDLIPEVVTIVDTLEGKEKKKKEEQVEEELPLEETYEGTGETGKSKEDHSDSTGVENKTEESGTDTSGTNGQTEEPGFESFWFVPSIDFRPDPLWHEEPLLSVWINRYGICPYKKKENHQG